MREARGFTRSRGSKWIWKAAETKRSGALMLSIAGCKGFKNFNAQVYGQSRQRLFFLKRLWTVRAAWTALDSVDSMDSAGQWGSYHVRSS